MMKIQRTWAMPNKWTFQVKPIMELIQRYIQPGWVDPFAGKYSPAEITNDIEQEATYNLDGLEFLQMFEAESVPGVIFDPPYSIEQCLRKYKPKHKGTAGSCEYRFECKREIARILKPDGQCISLGWDSQGIGAKRGFLIEEILLVCHGSFHRDTIVVVDKKKVKAKNRHNWNSICDYHSKPE